MLLKAETENKKSFLSVSSIILIFYGSTGHVEL
jgi:hypothetical protein